MSFAVAAGRWAFPSVSDALRRIDWPMLCLVAAVNIVPWTVFLLHGAVGYGQQQATQEAANQIIVTKMNALQSSLSGLEVKFDTLSSEVAPIPTVTYRVGQLEGAQTQLANQAQVSGQELTALRQKVDDLGARIANLENGTGVLHGSASHR